MADSGPCREPLAQSRNQKTAIKTRSASGGWPNSRTMLAASRRLCLREVQFHADAVRIVEKKLRVAGTRHDALAELYAFCLQALAHAVDIGCGKGDVVEPPGILVILLGAAHYDALARLARPHQMHRCGAAGVEPVAGEVERRTIAVLPSKHG